MNNLRRRIFSNIAPSFGEDIRPLSDDSVQFSAPPSGELGGGLVSQSQFELTISDTSLHEASAAMIRTERTRTGNDLSDEDAIKVVFFDGLSEALAKTYPPGIVHLRLRSDGAVVSDGR